MRAYSQDLRDKVIYSYTISKKSRLEISKIFGISYHTICEWIKRHRTTGDYSSKQGIGCGAKAKFTDKEQIINYIKNNPDADGLEIRNALMPEIAMSTFYDTMRRMDITYKKKEPKYKQRNESNRQEFLDYIKTIAPDNRLYIDEVGIDSNLSVEYGWSAKGQRSYGERSGFASERRSIVAAYNYGTKNIIAPFEYKGYMDKSLFVNWFKQVLCPNLIPGQVVILDNASFHKDEELYDCVKEKGCTLIYLPPYSPDLNPIEHFWANFKSNVRKVIKNFISLASALTHAMQITLCS